MRAVARRVPSVDLKVIGAGFGRTGTMSLKVALEELGFAPCYHMTELFKTPSHADLWNAAAHGSPIEWDLLLGDYAATVDWPGCSFYEELMESYLEAKVLLSVRDPERWYESTLNTIYSIRKTTTSSKLFATLGRFIPGVRHVARMVNNLIWEGTFDDRFEDRQYAMEVFDRHNEEVKQRVPPDRLLVYEVKEGWGPLCDFLEVEVPDKPFPQLNDSDSFRKMFVRRFAVAATVPALAMTLVAVLTIRRLRRPSGT